MRKDLLIVGKTPPPIGGVTIHVKRLLEGLDVIGFSHRFEKLTTNNLLNILSLIPKYKILHLHTSNIYIQLFIVIFCKFFHTKSIVTFHGDLARFTRIQKRVVRIIVRLSEIPITLNLDSQIYAERINKNAIQISAFIPPYSENKLPVNLEEDICKMKSSYKKLFVTNAYGMTFDKFGQEIYGIIDLVDYFQKVLNNCALIILDPSSAYKNYFDNNNVNLSNNILIIEGQYSFFEVLKFSDANIRNTSTDGDSLSVRESLYLGKQTFATSVVSRPTGTVVYERGDYHCLFCEKGNVNAKIEISSGFDHIIKLYKEILNK